MSKKSNSNQRADVKNPNNPAYKAATDNRSVQLNNTSITEKLNKDSVKPEQKK